MKGIRGLIGLLLLMAAAFCIGFGLSRGASYLPVNLPTQPETTAPFLTEASTLAPTAPPETIQSETAQPETVPPPTAPPAALPPMTQPPETTAPPVTVPPAKESNPYDIRGYVTGAFALEILRQIDHARAASGRYAFCADEGLSAIASVRAYELSLLHSVQRPDGRLQESLLQDYGYAYADAAACLACVSEDLSPALIVAGWLTQYEALILSDHFTHCGVEIYRSGGEVNVALFLVVPASDVP